VIEQGTILSMIKFNSKPWITSAIKKSMQVKNKLCRTYLKTKSSYCHSKFKYYRNKLNHYRNKLNLGNS
jgi:hypothetical protein